MPFFCSVINLLFPPRCLACRNFTQTDGDLCSTCWPNLSFIHEPFCNQCGAPLDYNDPDHTTIICGNCFDANPVFKQARACLVYDEYSRKLISHFKYHDKTAYRKIFGRWMVKTGETLFTPSTILAPVPLHRKKLFLRRYNQSYLLAKTIHDLTGRALVADLLLRHIHTPPQASLNKHQRQKNVKRAFGLNPIYNDFILGKHIILIDDVMTTGTTINACCQVLLKKGAEQVDVLTLARAAL